MLMMRPCRRSSMPGSAALRQAQVPPRLTAIVLEKCSHVSSCVGTAWRIPALLTSTSIRPNRSCVCRMKRNACSGSPTSACTICPSPPWTRAVATTSSKAPRSWRKLSERRSPRSAKRRAVAKPIPLPAPGMATTRCPAMPPLSGYAKSPVFAGPPGGQGPAGLGAGTFAVVAARDLGRELDHIAARIAEIDGMDEAVVRHPTGLDVALLATFVHLLEHGGIDLERDMQVEIVLV